MPSMKFQMTMNMPSSQGSLVHQITCECDGITSMEQFCQYIAQNEFVNVRQFYKVGVLNDGQIEWEFKGHIIVNTNLIGKVTEYSERQESGHTSRTNQRGEMERVARLSRIKQSENRR